MKEILLVVSLSLVLSACASKGTVDKDAQVTQDRNVEKLYAEAQDELNSNNHTRAIKLYELLESRFPSGRYTQQFQLDIVYAYYKGDEPEKAPVVIERFQRHHPQHPNMNYVLCLKDLVLLNEDQSFLDKLASQDWSDRDPKANRDVYQASSQLVQLHLNSKYASDVTECMTKSVDVLGGNETAIVRYYMKRGAYFAAINRARKTIEQYQNTRYVEESSAIMELAYRKLGKPQLAADNRHILAGNFPASPYLQKPWRLDDMSWWRYWR